MSYKFNPKFQCARSAYWRKISRQTHWRISSLAIRTDSRTGSTCVKTIKQHTGNKHAKRPNLKDQVHTWEKKRDNRARDQGILDNDIRYRSSLNDRIIEGVHEGVTLLQWCWHGAWWMSVYTCVVCTGTVIQYPLHWPYQERGGNIQLYGYGRDDFAGDVG